MADIIKPAEVSYIQDVPLNDALRLAALSDESLKTRLDARFGVGDFGTTVSGASGGTVPPGGTTGQILAKNSATDYDTKWVADATGTSTAAGNLYGVGSSEPLTAGAVWINPTISASNTRYNGTTSEINFDPPDLSTYQTDYPYVYNTPIIKLWITNLQYYSTSTSSWKQTTFAQFVREVHPNYSTPLQSSQSGYDSQYSYINAYPYIDTGTATKLGLWIDWAVYTSLTDWTSRYQYGMRWQFYYEIYAMPADVVTIITA